MSQPDRVFPTALALRGLVIVGAVLAVLAAVVSSVLGVTPTGPGFGAAAFAVVAVGAATRRLGISLPGQGFASYIAGVGLFAILHRGWAFAVLTAPIAIVLGDVVLRQIALRRAVVTAVHFTAGAAVIGLAYEALHGAAGATALDTANLGLLAFLVFSLPLPANGTHYLELRAARALAGIDP